MCVHAVDAVITGSLYLVCSVCSEERRLHARRATENAKYWEKLPHRHSLLELRAPQAGIVKDLVTHTAGSVVSPGTVVRTLVPHNDPMQAEVCVVVSLNLHLNGN